MGGAKGESPTPLEFQRERIHLFRCDVERSAYIGFSKQNAGVKQQKRSEEEWVIETLTGLVRCTKPRARTVAMNAKCHSSPQRGGPSTVERVGKNIDRQDESIDDIRNAYLISQESDF